MSPNEILPAVEIRRRLQAPPERVYAAWTTPEVVRRWWCANENYECPMAEIDLRIGGSYRLAMRSLLKDVTHVVQGRFLVIDPPRRLVYTWSWQHVEPAQECRVTVNFHPAGDGHCEIVILHELLPTESDRLRHAEGWTGVLGMLEKVLAEGPGTAAS